ncbi:MAG TPA: glycoside hydrolase family 16 protein [Trebonia sp.]|nr:glycoside hydrolase family 16 protein [Trebonia sp.]
MPLKLDAKTHERAAARKGNRPRVRTALTTLTAVLAVVAIMLVAAYTAAPPAAPQPAEPVPQSAGPAPHQAGPLLQSAGPAPQPTGPKPVPATWKLAFSTGFPGTELDTSTWGECYPWFDAAKGCTNFGNSDEAEWYLPSQIHVENGKLALVARRTPTEGTTENGKPKTYTCRSGMVTTYPSVYFRYGYVQVVARLPFGKGLWPAIWLIPEDGSWPPEIDIAEHWDTQPTVAATLHTGKDNAQQRGLVDFPEAGQGWHTYTLYWTPSRISVYYDRKLALTTTKDVPRKPMYLLLDLADENTSPGSCSGTMYVKSVGIWEAPQQPAR